MFDRGKGTKVVLETRQRFDIIPSHPAGVPGSRKDRMEFEDLVPNVKVILTHERDAFEDVFSDSREPVL
jgi:hypothetical protein